jgi:hypothetical protein
MITPKMLKYITGEESRCHPSVGIVVHNRPSNSSNLSDSNLLGFQGLLYPGIFKKKIKFVTEKLQR